MMRGQRLQGLVVAVTGGARGIGAATAELLTQQGARVAIGDVDQDLAQQTAARTGAIALPLDVADSGSWTAFVVGVEERLGPIDVLVNNAGIMPIGPFLDERESVMRRQLAINIEGVLLGSRAVLPGMLTRRRGHVINIASQAGKIGLAGLATYHATKWAVVGLSHSLDDEYRDTRVDVSCILPGIVDTELSAGLPSSRLAPRIAPAEIAKAVASTIERPRREVWVPSSGRVAMTVFRSLPARTRARLFRLVGLEDVNLKVDPHARAPYENRVAPRRPEHDPVSARSS